MHGSHLYFQRMLLCVLCFLTLPALANNNATRIATFKQSWTANTLKFQREIDLNTPLNQATFLGTHNSYNSRAYQTPYRYSDTNQLLSIYDQLETGVRSVELDAHWSRTGTHSQDILLCHSDDDHHECDYFDRKFTDGLAEIRDWLAANPGEVVLLYIERHVDHHNPRLAAMLDEYVGRYIFKPSLVRDKQAAAGSCVALPGTLTKAQVLRAGKQLLIVTKGCESPLNQVEQDKFKLNWNDFGFAGIGMIPEQIFSFIDVVPDEFNGYPDCGKSQAFFPDINHTSLWRVYEDGTMGTSHVKRMDETVMRDIVRCGINWQTMDQLDIADPRLTAAIWSWAPGYPQVGKGACAMYESGKGMVNAACDEFTSGYACKDDFSHEFTTVVVKGKWRNGEAACQKFVGVNWHFAMPVNGQQMFALKLSVTKNNLQSIWLNYRDET